MIIFFYIEFYSIGKHQDIEMDSKKCVFQLWVASERLKDEKKKYVLHARTL